MEEMRDFLEEHKKAVVFAALAIVLFFGLSASRCASLQLERAQQQEQQQQRDAPAPQQEQQDAVQSEQDAALARLTDAQRQRQAGYDDATAEFVAMLASNLWTARNDTYYLTFGPTTYTDHSPDGEATHPYVVNSLSSKKSSEDGVETEVSTAAMETDASVYILTCTKTTDGESGDTEVSISSDAFTVGAQDSYSRDTKATGSLSVSGLGADIDALLGGRTDDMVLQLQDYCAANVPSATMAAWEGIVTCDYNEGVMRTTFRLDNSTKSQLVVTYGIDTGAFAVAAGASN